MTYNALSHGLPSHCGHPQLALRNVYTLSATSDREDPTVYNGHYSYSLLTIRGPSPSEARSILPHDATQSAVLPWQVVHLSVFVCPSIRLSATLRHRGHIGWNS